MASYGNFALYPAHPNAILNWVFVAFFVLIVNLLSIKFTIGVKLKLKVFKFQSFIKWHKNGLDLSIKRTAEW